MMLDIKYHKFYCWLSIALAGCAVGALWSAWAWLAFFSLNAVCHAIMDVGMRMSKESDNGNG